MLVTVSDWGDNKGQRATHSLIKWLTFTASIFSLVLLIPLNFSYDVVKIVFLIVTKSRTDKTIQCSVTAELDMQFCNEQTRAQPLFSPPCASATYGSARMSRRKNYHKLIAWLMEKPSTGVSMVPSCTFNVFENFWMIHTLFECSIFLVISIKHNLVQHVPHINTNILWFCRFVYLWIITTFPGRSVTSSTFLFTSFAEEPPKTQVTCKNTGGAEL